MNETETIFCKLWNCSRSDLYLNHHRRELTGCEQKRLQAIFEARRRGEPLQYLLGDADFMGLKLGVKPGVLIPRPETEVLVDEAIRRFKDTHQAAMRILDIGTGSGNIAIALAAFLPARLLEEVVAVDISRVSLSVARANAKACGVAHRIRFLKSNIFSALTRERFDAIVSNPPYVAPREYRYLPAEVRREPKEALVASSNGLCFYKKIAEAARMYLKDGGYVFLEIGKGQENGIRKIFARQDLWSEVEFTRDLRGIKRVAIIRGKYQSIKVSESQ